MICYIKEIQGLLSTLTKKVLFFKDFKALKNQWWISSTFKHFKDLYEPCIMEINVNPDQKLFRYSGPRFTKNLKSDPNHKHISGAKMHFTKIIILWLGVFSNITKLWEWLDVVVTI